MASSQQHQIIWMGMTRTQLLGRKRLVMSPNDRLRILQDAAQNLWSKDFISPARFVQLMILLDCPFYEGKPVTVICMEKTLNTIAGLVTPKMLGDGLRSDISDGSFSFSAHLRSHILSSTTLREALAVPLPPATSPNGPPARLRGRSDVPHRSNASLIQASIALLEQEGSLSGHRRSGRGGGDGKRDAGQKEKYRRESEEEKKVRAMIALLEKTCDRRANSKLLVHFGVTLDDIIERRFRPFQPSGESSDGEEAEHSSTGDEDDDDEDEDEDDDYSSSSDGDFSDGS